ncbi:uncharacterized protein LOC126906888 [Daktulosphaira vitifoliae]|uniref:uncharacterized protein LOC126906888 n=1 Tax=Daktulosphaira vitifoliae TaxID=58002 RepID=UPI0021AA628B|nr:uncharacterized protein LOC126906888 [Daktulosphaira vitifoliae]
MFSLKFVKFSFLLFYVILYTKADTTSIKAIDQLDKILKYPGWKNLNDVHFIKYYDINHYLQNQIQTPTKFYKCGQKIRVLTIYLGCTYAKVMVNLFTVINNVLINGSIYIEELINIIAILIVPIATFMKSAMDALDLLHNKPWATFKKNYKYHYMISPLLERIGNILDKLNDPGILYNYRSTKFCTFDIVNIFSKSIINDLQYETEPFCEFVLYDKNELWNKWIQEYNAIINQGVKLIFFTFLTIKIKDYIKTVTIEKYFQLGFKFDPITGETFVPTREELIELELEFKAIDQEPPTSIQIENH